MLYSTEPHTYFCSNYADLLFFGIHWSVGKEEYNVHKSFLKCTEYDTKVKQIQF